MTHATTARGARFAAGRRLAAAAIALAGAFAALATARLPDAPASPPDHDARPGARTMLSAHNCYPYHTLWSDRLDRALALDRPIAIEQDLCWTPASGDRPARSVVAHNGPFDGNEPTLADHFFERVRPIVEAERAAGDRRHWPRLVLDLDIKDNALPHIEAIDAVLRTYEAWLTTAERLEDPDAVSPLRVGPIMVIASGSGPQQDVFHDRVPVGGRLIVFGAAETRRPDTAGLSPEDAARRLATCDPAELVDRPATNFRRWWNNPWHVVEPGGAPGGGAWTPTDQRRLHALCDHAHRLGYFIRFYAINGASGTRSAAMGWSRGYNTGSLEAASVRWRAAAIAGVDFIATDQYEDAARALADHGAAPRGTRAR